MRLRIQQIEHEARQRLGPGASVLRYEAQLPHQRYVPGEIETCNLGEWYGLFVNGELICRRRTPGELLAAVEKRATQISTGIVGTR